MPIPMNIAYIAITQITNQPMKPYYSILSFLFGCIMFANCDCKRVCTNAIPVVSFTNFDSVQLHVVVLKAYGNDGKFDQLQSVQVYSNIIEHGVDTIFFNNNSTIILNFFTDYTVEIPSVNKTWYIRNVSSHYDKMQANACTAGMTYYLNDTMHTIAPNNLMANQAGYIDITN